MAQITFGYKSLRINLSTHGYYIIYTNKMPTWKHSEIGGHLEENGIKKLGGRYIKDDDDVEPDIEELKGNAINYLKKNYEKLKKLEAQELNKWKEKQGKKVEGQDVCIGDLVRFKDGEPFYLLGIKGNHIDGISCGLNKEKFSCGLNKEKLVKVIQLKKGRKK